MRRSMRVGLTVAFMGLAIGPVLLVGVVLAWRSYTMQQQQALYLVTIPWNVNERLCCNV